MKTNFITGGSRWLGRSMAWPLAPLPQILAEAARGITLKRKLCFQV